MIGLHQSQMMSWSEGAIIFAPCFPKANTSVVSNGTKSHQRRRIFCCFISNSRNPRFYSCYDYQFDFASKCGLRKNMSIGKSLLRKASLPSFGRVALVKQDVHNDLYYRVSPASSSEIVYSSILRSGPVALFTALDADYLVVQADSAPECQIWQQKVTDCKHNPKHYYDSFQSKVRRWGCEFDHSTVSQSVDSIDWSIYDLVISIDIAIPTRIVRANPQVIWAYYVSEPCMSFYKESLHGAQFGYDLFLTLGFQKMRPTRESATVLEFPYFLQYVGCFQDLDGTENPEFLDRKIISAERHSHQLMCEDDLELISSRFGEVKSNFGTLRSLVDGLRSAKFHLRMDGKAIWGNSFIEAACLGALLVGSVNLIKYRLIIDQLRVSGIAEAVEKMALIEKDPDFRVACETEQNALVNDICFIRPLTDLADALERVRTMR